MNQSHETTTVEELPTPPQRHATLASDSNLRKWVIWGGVIGNALLSAYFFGFMIYQTIWGGAEPTNWLVKLTLSNYAAMVGTPMSAVTAFSIVSLLKATSGPIEFEALGFKFRGASGPIVLWVLCFLSIVLAFRLLWPMTPNKTDAGNGSYGISRVIDASRSPSPDQ
ncbi:MAG: hypothetical protein B7Z37_27710 [Verrucomicrobia bacterium 12-59-8]|nr:MAG: hypothetical protein B7Z37_27710 [Verrucomicrobia bacterium 12-59-8]